MQDQRLLEGEDILDSLADEAAGPLPRELLGSGIDGGNGKVGRQRDNGERQAGNDALGIRPAPITALAPVRRPAHAATRPAGAAMARP